MTEYTLISEGYFSSPKWLDEKLKLIQAAESCCGRFLAAPCASSIQCASLGRICSDKFPSCPTMTEVADQKLRAINYAHYMKLGMSVTVCFHVSTIQTCTHTHTHTHACTHTHTHACTHTHTHTHTHTLKAASKTHLCRDTSPLNKRRDMAIWVSTSLKNCLSKL